MGQTGHPAKQRIVATMVVAAIAVAAGVASVVSACATTPRMMAIDPIASPQPTATGEPSPALGLAIGPVAGSTNLPISTEIAITLASGRVRSVTLRKAGTTAALPGALRADGSSWVPSKSLEFNTTYDVSVTAISDDGATTETATTSFTTMGRFSRTTGVSLLPAKSGAVLGVAMPIRVTFGYGVPTKYRAGVERRLFVISDPPQPGVWHWASSSEVWYRPPNYWESGTKITVEARLHGVPTGDNRYGQADRSVSYTIGEKVFMLVDDDTKTMKVYRNDELVRTIPVSLGKPSTPTSSGHFVIFAKYRYTRFITEEYNTPVNNAMKLTYRGEYIHGAWWSEGVQGFTNVSHGCTNVSEKNAAWLYDITKIGDPVIIRNTGSKVRQGNGWTLWNLTWQQWIAKSALPVPADLAALKGVDPTTGIAPKISPKAPGAAATATPTPSAA